MYVCEGVWVWVSGIMQQRCEPMIALFYKQTSHPHPPSNISRALFLHFLILFPFDLLLRFFLSVSAYVSALFLLLRIKRIQHSSLTEWGLSYQHILFLSECFSIFELRPLFFLFWFCHQSYDIVINTFDAGRQTRLRSSRSLTNWPISLFLTN